MPRNGSGVYSLPPGTEDMVPSTVIESSVQDSLTGDIQTAFNTAWPVSLGGTGGTSVITSWDAIASAEDTVASAATLVLTALTKPFFNISGTTGVTAVTQTAGTVRFGRIAGATLAITASATLIVEGQTSGVFNYVQNDELKFEGYAASTVRVSLYAHGGATRANDGTVSLPGLSFFLDPDSGWYRIGANNIAAAVNGAKVLDVATTGLTVTGTLNATTTAAGTISTLTSTEAGSSSGPDIILDRNSASPTASDALSSIIFRGRDSGGNATDYGYISVGILDPTNGSEDGFMRLGGFLNGFGNTDLLALHLSTSGTFAAGVVALPQGKLMFPPTQDPSSNANTLDDYEEGTWTPVLTAATPGNLAVAYTTQVGTYTKVGRLVTATCTIVTSSFTYTSASGALQITGLPVTPMTLTGYAATGAVFYSGFTRAGYTNVVARVVSASATINLVVSGSGVAGAVGQITDFPTAGSVIIQFTIVYESTT